MRILRDSYYVVRWGTLCPDESVRLCRVRLLGHVVCEDLALFDVSTVFFIFLDLSVCEVRFVSLCVVEYGSGGRCSRGRCYCHSSTITFYCKNGNTE